MRPRRAAADALRLQGALAAMAWQAAIVVPLRLQVLAASLVSQRASDQGEVTRMLSEKLAATTGALAASALALRGGDPVRVAVAAMGPSRRVARSNARRLSAR